MRIDAIELQTIRLKLREPFRISSGSTFHRHILIVRLQADGLTGFGECVAGETPSYSYETVQTARWVLAAHLIPAVLGKSFHSPQQLAACLETTARGHSMAKAAIEMAAWDIAARARGLSLARLLGGERDAVPSGVSIGIQPDLPALLQRIEGFIDEGYRRIKIKIAPGQDLLALQAVRAAFPDVPLSVDANAAYTAEHASLLESFDEFRLAMVEQPFAADAFFEHAALQRRITTPLCLDESVTSPATCALALRLGAGKIVNIKPGRVGGFTNSLRIHDLCRDNNVPVWCGGMLESGIGRAHNVALASLPNFSLPGDTSASRRYWERDVVQPEFVLRPDGTVAVPAAPGIGVQIDEDFLASIQEERRRFRAAT